MTIINITSQPRYSSIADRYLRPGEKSSDTDIAGFSSALSKVIESCEGIYGVILNNAERKNIYKLIDLDDLGRSIKPNTIKAPPTPFEKLLAQDAAEKKEKIAILKAARAKENAIMSETTYASRKDIDLAKEKSRTLKGDVPAKKLEKKEGEQISLNDLMGDNKFIEERMKYSNVRTAVASEEGWDMEKMNEPKVSTNVEPVSEKPVPEQEPETEEKPAKKSSRRRRKESK